MDGFEDVGRATQILQCKFHEQRLVRQTSLPFLGNGLIVSRGAPNGFVKNRRIRGEAGDRKIGHIALQRAVVENFPGDVVQPEALLQPMQFFSGVHGESFFFSQRGSEIWRRRAAISSSSSIASATPE